MATSLMMTGAAEKQASAPTTLARALTTRRYS
jgi:hypothetical protein